MWIKDEIAKLNPQRKDLRQFSWVLGGALAALSALAWYKGSPAFPYLLGAGSTLALVGTLAPLALRHLYFVWMAIGLTLGTVMTAIILTIVFVVAIIPIGLVMKALGRDPMHRRLDREATTYWIPKEPPGSDRTHYLKYF
jgi:hypothetical protein